MRDASVEFGRLVSRSRRPIIELTSWLGDELLAEIPIIPGSWSVIDAADADVPGEVTFSVPNVPQWRPTTPDHPLASFGQVIRPRLGMEVAGVPELLQYPPHRIMSCLTNGENLDVRCQGLLVNVERYRFLQPVDVADGASRTALATKLVQGILPLSVELANATASAGTWEQSRIEALREVVEGWPARCYVDDTGTLVITAPWSDTFAAADVELVDGPAGTLLNVAPVEDADDEDSGRFNAYVVSTVPEGDEAPVSATVYLTTGPMAWGGPFGYRPGFYSSPLLPADTTRLQQVGQTMLERSRRRAQALTFEAAPDPRVQVGDVAHLRSAAAGIDTLARITQLTIQRDRMSGSAAYAELGVSV